MEAIPDIFKIERKNDVIEKEFNSFTVYLKKFSSNNQKYLLPDDQNIAENNEFFYYLIKPRKIDRINDVVIISHGLNEQRYQKMLPWALELVKNNFAVIIFPMAFHINRRPKEWSIKGSFNKRVSERLTENPKRFYLGGLQSYFDVMSLVKKIKLIEKEDFYEDLFSEDTKVHFLGYSASGYLVLILHLINQDNLFSDSKSVLFCSGASVDFIDPATIYIMSKEASESLFNFYKSYSMGDTEFNKLYNTEIGFWFKNIFLNTDNEKLEEKLNELGKNILVIANSNDKIIKAEGIKRNLKGLRIIELGLGIHEFPFNNIGYEEDYESAVSAIRNNIGTIHFNKEFNDFIQSTAKFLRGD